MWNRDNYYIKFVPEPLFTDPSYHLPHFYELFAERANGEDREFWRIAAKESREYLKLSAHSVTGMSPGYAEYDGPPRRIFHDGQFYSDVYRVAMNIGLDASWFGQDESLSNIDKLQAFFSNYCDQCSRFSYSKRKIPIRLGKRLLEYVTTYR